VARAAARAGLDDHAHMRGLDLVMVVLAAASRKFAA